MIVLATYNIKGGVGKTTAAVNLAYLASRAGLRTLVWDLDPHGAATFYFRVEAERSADASRLLDKKQGLGAAIRSTDYARLDLLPASLGLRHLDLELSEFKKPTERLQKLLNALDGDYDVAFLDCAPNLSLVSENIFGMADWLLVPLIPTPLSLRAYEQLKSFCISEGLDAGKLLPFFSMVDRRRQLHCGIVTSFAAEHPELLRSFVPYTSLVERMGEQRAPVQVFAAGSPGARAFEALWKACATRIGLLEPEAANGAP
jgi:chromosome partitioning protein